jgi:hypothetical protein
VSLFLIHHSFQARTLSQHSHFVIFKAVRQSPKETGWRRDDFTSELRLCIMRSLTSISPNQPSPTFF